MNRQTRRFNEFQLHAGQETSHYPGIVHGPDSLMFFAFITTILFSVSAVAATRSIRSLGSGPANFWRLLVATAFLGLVAFTFGQGLSGPAFPYFFASGCIGFGIGDIALFLALPRLGSRLTVLLTQCLAAPIAGVVEWLWIGTRLTEGQIICSAMILVGVAVALAPKSRPHFVGRAFLSGLVFGIVAAFGQGLGAVVSRKAYEISASAGVSIDGPTAAFQRILGGILITSLALIPLRTRTPALNPAAPVKSEETPHDEPTRHNHSTRAWLWVVVNGLAGPALGVSCFQWALATTPSAIVLPIVALTPITVIPLTLILEGDRPRPQAAFGAVVAVAGAIALTFVH